MFHFDGKPAPGELVRVQGFLNTWSEELDLEDLPNAAAAQRWLHEAQLLPPEQSITPAELDRLHAFRQALRNFILEPEAETEAEAGDPLHAFLEHLTFGLQLDSEHHLSLQPKGNASDRVIGALTTIVFAAMQNGTWERLGCCQLPTCGWAFYDHTRSRTKRWCSMKTCGSRNKSREFYKRKKSSSD